MANENHETIFHNENKQSKLVDDKENRDQEKPQVKNIQKEECDDGK